jgi:hypothetical protein
MGRENNSPNSQTSTKKGAFSTLKFLGLLSCLRLASSSNNVVAGILTSNGWVFFPRSLVLSVPLSHTHCTALAFSQIPQFFDVLGMIWKRKKSLVWF